MLPLCADQGGDVLPWSPLVRDRLTREWGTVTERAARATTSAAVSTRSGKSTAAPCSPS